MALDLSLGMTKNGWEANVISLLDVDEFTDAPHSDVSRESLMPMDSYRWPRVVPALGRSLREAVSRAQPDAVVSHGPTAAIVLAQAKISPPPLQVFHGNTTFLRGTTVKDRAMTLWEKRSFRALGGRAIAVSRAIAEKIHQHFGSAAHVQTILNGVDLGLFGPSPT